MTLVQSKKLTIAGWSFSLLVSIGLLMSAGVKFAQPPEVVENLKKTGLDEFLLMPIGLVELICTICFLVPRTSFLGSILLTGYLGGAVFAHVRIQDMFFAPLAFGIVVWIGYGLRHVEDMKRAFHIV